MRHPKSGHGRSTRKIKPFLLWGAFSVLLLMMPPAVFSQDPAKEAAVPEILHAGLKHLLSQVGGPPLDDKELSVEAIQPLLDFVAADKPQDTMYYVDESFGMTSAYHEFVLKKDFDHLLRFSYNPNIPAHITTPSSVRFSLWSDPENKQNAFPNMLGQLGHSDRPVVIRGIETIENTPDLNTGGYYKYDLDRTIYLLSREGKKILISLSKQRDASEVGKKGVVLGSDEDWNYLYSGIKGLNKTGLGWVSSYMYDSYSVIIHYEVEPGKPLVKCAVFKWLNAGWKSINMVKKYHIYRGLERYAETYKAIVEKLTLSDAGAIEQSYARISHLDVSTLRHLNRRVLASFKERYVKDRAMSERWIADLFTDEAYVDSMDRDELQALLALECLKRALGKSYAVDLEQL